MGDNAVVPVGEAEQALGARVVRPEQRFDLSPSHGQPAAIGQLVEQQLEAWEGKACVHRA